MNLPNKNKHVTKQQISIQQQHHKEEFYSGPVPKPDDLQKYEQIQPGFADRLLKMAEKEQIERFNINNKILSDTKDVHLIEANNHKRGQNYALLSIIIIVVLCGYCVYSGSPNNASAIAIGTLVAIVGVFISGKILKKDTSTENK